MQKWVCLLLVNLGWMPSLFGAASSASSTVIHDGEVVGHTQNGVPIVQRSHVVYSDSSEAYRQNIHHQFSFGIGLLVGSMTYGYLLRPDWVLESYVQKQLEFVEGESFTGTV